MAKDSTVEPPTVVHNGHLQTTRVITEEAAPLDVDTPSSSGTITPEMGTRISKKRKLPELQETVNKMLEQNERHHREEMKEKRVIIVISLVVIFGVGYFIYRVMKKRQKRGLLLAEISSEDEDSADEVFRAPGTSRQSDDFDFNTIRDDEAVLIEIPKVSIDFEDILHNSQK
ncbi:hypothetical protein FQA39_LY01612 [Lamprigera yunnana]|nr:hypothetical protein FQA39_LY01612 [Lamprigera yunnana]